MSTKHSRTIYAAATLVGVCAALSACTTSSGSTVLPTVSSASATTAVSGSPPVSPPSNAADSASALAAYSGFWSARVATYASPQLGASPSLRRYSIDKAFADTRATALIYAENGIVRHGGPSHFTTVAIISTGTQAALTITDCLDTTHWQPIYIKTGKSAAAPGQSKRVMRFPRESRHLGFTRPCRGWSRLARS
jgi:hypothetical protein